MPSAAVDQVWFLSEAECRQLLYPCQTHTLQKHSPVGYIGDHPMELHERITGVFHYGLRSEKFCIRRMAFVSVCLNIGYKAHGFPFFP